MWGIPFDKTANPFPSETSNVADVDTASGLHLVLNREGECSFHGARQQDMVTGLELKAPGVLPGVTAVSCARYQAWFLMKDGSVTATSDFREKPPVWAKLPNDFKRGIRSLVTGASGSRFAAITATGKALLMPKELRSIGSSKTSSKSARRCRHPPKMCTVHGTSSIRAMRR